MPVEGNVNVNWTELAEEKIQRWVLRKPSGYVHCDQLGDYQFFKTNLLHDGKLDIYMGWYFIEEMAENNYILK